MNFVRVAIFIMTVFLYGGGIKSMLESEYIVSMLYFLGAGGGTYLLIKWFRGDTVSTSRQITIGLSIIGMYMLYFGIDSVIKESCMNCFSNIIGTVAIIGASFILFLGFSVWLSEREEIRNEKN